MAHSNVLSWGRDHISEAQRLPARSSRALGYEETLRAGRLSTSDNQSGSVTGGKSQKLDMI